MSKKHIQKRRARKLWFRRIKSKKKQKQKRKKLLQLKREDRDVARYLLQNWDIVKVKAPKNFSFVENTNDVIAFINKLSNHYERREKVFVILKNTETLTYDALVVLLSIMIKFKTAKIEFNGDVPKNKSAREILIQSGFIEYLYLDNYKHSDSYNIHTRNSIHTHAQKLVDSALGDKIISGASRTVWGEKRRCQGIQKTFLELMLNTNNHADVEMEGVKHWWLSVSHLPEEKKVAFSFVDFGVGVFNSLDQKTTRSKWYQWAQKLAAIFQFNNNADVLRLILQGEMHRTVTKEPYRGNGLPGLKLALDRNQLSNLRIITNNVRADVKNDKYDILNQNFNGTFVYWELNENNRSCDGNA